MLILMILALLVAAYVALRLYLAWVFPPETIRDPATIGIGCVVTKTGGGPVMTVLSVDDAGVVECARSEEGDIVTEFFPAAGLRLHGSKRG